MNGHERGDVDARRILRVVPIFIAVGIVIHLAVWWMFAYYRTQGERRDVRHTLIDIPSQAPPEPRLQVNPPLDWQAYRESQQNILSSYGWASREQGRVRMPVERAMELMVEREGADATRK
jgi:hypothetical protein